MMIGIDFDNTIVSCDPVFRAVAKERGHFRHVRSAGWDDRPPCRTEIRDRLRAEGLELEWRQIQGLVYGPRLDEAVPFPGVHLFLRRAKERAIPIFIVSHRTQYPDQGLPWDLHAAARQWCSRHGIAGELVPEERIFFETTRERKIARIGELARQGLSLFVDDLVEVLGDPSFPGNVTRVLFDPFHLHDEEGRFERAHSYAQMSLSLLSRRAA